MAAFSQSKVWHSYLKTASPLVIRFSSDIMDSKYDASQKIVYFDVRGDDGDYYLVIENETVLNRVKATAKKQWIKVTASGKDEDADILIESPDSSDMAATAQTVGNSSGGGGGSSSSGGGPRYGPTNIFDSWMECVKLVEDRIPGTVEDGTLNDFGLRHANTLFIQHYRTGRFVPLYDGQSTEDQYGAPEEGADAGGDDSAERDPRLEAIEEFLDTLKWEGEAHDKQALSDVKERLQKLVKEGGDDPNVVSRALVWCKSEHSEQQLPF